MPMLRYIGVDLEHERCWAVRPSLWCGQSDSSGRLPSMIMTNQSNQSVKDKALDLLGKLKS
jgi:hypothetical protein